MSIFKNQEEFNKSLIETKGLIMTEIEKNNLPINIKWIINDDNNEIDEFYLKFTIGYLLRNLDKFNDKQLRLLDSYLKYDGKNKIKECLVDMLDFDERIPSQIKSFEIAGVMNQDIKSLFIKFLETVKTKFGDENNIYVKVLCMGLHKEEIILHEDLLKHTKNKFTMINSLVSFKRSQEVRKEKVKIDEHFLKTYEEFFKVYVQEKEIFQHFGKRPLAYEEKEKFLLAKNSILSNRDDLEGFLNTLASDLHSKHEHKSKSYQLNEFLYNLFSQNDISLILNSNVSYEKTVNKKIENLKFIAEYRLIIEIFAKLSRVEIEQYTIIQKEYKKKNYTYVQEYIKNVLNGGNQSYIIPEDLLNNIIEVMSKINHIVVSNEILNNYENIVSILNKDNSLANFIENIFSGERLNVIKDLSLNSIQKDYLFVLEDLEQEYENDYIDTVIKMNSRYMNAVDFFQKDILTGWLLTESFDLTINPLHILNVDFEHLSLENIASLKNEYIKQEKVLAFLTKDLQVKVVSVKNNHFILDPLDPKAKAFLKILANFSIPELIENNLMEVVSQGLTIAYRNMNNRDFDYIIEKFEVILKEWALIEGNSLKLNNWSHIIAIESVDVELHKKLKDLDETLGNYSFFDLELDTNTINNLEQIDGHVFNVYCAELITKFINERSQSKKTQNHEMLYLLSEDFFNIFKLYNNEEKNIFLKHCNLENKFIVDLVLASEYNEFKTIMKKAGFSINKATLIENEKNHWSDKEIYEVLNEDLFFKSNDILGQIKEALKFINILEVLKKQNKEDSINYRTIQIILTGNVFLNTKNWIQKINSNKNDIENELIKQIIIYAFDKKLIEDLYYENDINKFLRSISLNNVDFFSLMLKNKSNIRNMFLNLCLPQSLEINDMGSINNEMKKIFLGESKVDFFIELITSEIGEENFILFANWIRENEEKNKTKNENENYVKKIITYLTKQESITENKKRFESLRNEYTNLPKDSIFYAMKLYADIYILLEKLDIVCEPKIGETIFNYYRNPNASLDEFIKVFNVFLQENEENLNKFFNKEFDNTCSNYSEDRKVLQDNKKTFVEMKKIELSEIILKNIYITKDNSDSEIQQFERHINKGYYRKLLNFMFENYENESMAYEPSMQKVKRNLLESLNFLGNNSIIIAKIANEFKERAIKIIENKDALYKIVADRHDAVGLLSSNIAFADDKEVKAFNDLEVRDRAFFVNNKLKVFGDLIQTSNISSIDKHYAKRSLLDLLRNKSAKEIDKEINESIIYIVNNKSEESLSVLERIISAIKGELFSYTIDKCVPSNSKSEWNKNEDTDAIINENSFTKKSLLELNNEVKPILKNKKEKIHKEMFLEFEFFKTHVSRLQIEDMKESIKNIYGEIEINDSLSESHVKYNPNTKVLREAYLCTNTLDMFNYIVENIPKTDAKNNKMFMRSLKHKIMPHYINDKLNLMLENGLTLNDLISNNILVRDEQIQELSLDNYIKFVNEFIALDFKNLEFLTEKSSVIPSICAEYDKVLSFELIKEIDNDKKILNYLENLKNKTSASNYIYVYNKLMSHISPSEITSSLIDMKELNQKEIRQELKSYLAKVIIKYENIDHELLNQSLSEEFTKTRLIFPHTHGKEYFPDPNKSLVWSPIESEILNQYEIKLIRNLFSKSEDFILLYKPITFRHIGEILDNPELKEIKKYVLNKNLVDFYLNTDPKIHIDINFKNTVVEWLIENRIENKQSLSKYHLEELIKLHTNINLPEKFLLNIALGNSVSQMDARLLNVIKNDDMEANKKRYASFRNYTKIVSVMSSYINEKVLEDLVNVHRGITLGEILDKETPVNKVKRNKQKI